MDLETFIIMIYVLVDDWYQQAIAPYKPKRGRPPRMSDSEVLTIALVGAWRTGVPWQSERGLVRYIQRHQRSLFPTMLQRSQFNARTRRLYGVLVRLQQALVTWLETEPVLYECVDCLPIPAGSNGQYRRDNSHWLPTATIGQGAGQFFWGDHLLLVVTPKGSITGWLVAAADIQDRWLLEGLLSARVGQAQLVAPPVRQRASYAQRPRPPVGFMGGFEAVGSSLTQVYLADKAFNGQHWQTHWRQRYQATVIAVPGQRAILEQTWTRAQKGWLASHRQIVETVFAVLDGVFGIKRLQAHSRWGQYTRLALKTAAHNLGLFINRLLGRPLLALGTLLC